MYVAFSDIKKFGADLKDVLQLSINKEDSNSINNYITDPIEINEISVNNMFSHSRSKDYLIKNIKFTLKPGDYLGISGKSGTGKSTLLDIILGFLTQ